MKFIRMGITDDYGSGYPAFALLLCLPSFHSRISGRADTVKNRAFFALVLLFSSAPAFAGGIEIFHNDIVKWMGILFGAWGIGFASGYLFRAFKRLLELAGNG